MHLRARYVAFGTLISCITFCAVPREKVLVPRYEVLLVDGAGKPLANVAVHQYQQDYSSSPSVDRTVEAVTNTEGLASFNSVEHTLTSGSEIVGCASQIVSTGAHASCGFHADITASSSNYVETARDVSTPRGEPHQRKLKLTLTNCPSGNYFECSESGKQRSG